MQHPYRERIEAAREIASSVVALFDDPAGSPSPTTINRLLVSVERLADLAEDIEAEQTVKALDG